MKRNLTVKEVASFLESSSVEIITKSHLISDLFYLVNENSETDENKIFTVTEKSLVDSITNISPSGDDSNEGEKLCIDPKDAHKFFIDRLLLQFNKNDDSDIEWNFPEEKNSYLINYLTEHMYDASRRTESQQLLISLPWMIKTLEEKGATALINDFKSHLRSDQNDNSDFQIAYKMVLYVLQLSHDILSPQEGQNFAKRLPIQLYGRLNGLLLNNYYIQSLRQSCMKWFTKNLKFIPKRLFLEAPGDSKKAQLNNVSYILVNVYIYIYLFIYFKLIATIEIISVYNLS